MKLGPVTKLYKRNTATSMTNHTDNNVMSENCDVILFLPIYRQFAAIRRPDSIRMFYKTFINSNRLQNLKTELKNF